MTAELYLREREANKCESRLKESASGTWKTKVDEEKRIREAEGVKSEKNRTQEDNWMVPVTRKYKFGLTFLYFALQIKQHAMFDLRPLTRWERKNKLSEITSTAGYQLGPFFL